MRIEKLWAVGCVSATFILIGLLVLVQASQQFPIHEDNGRPDFPFEVKSEQNRCCIGGPMWTAVIILPEQYFDREHLEKLFRFYSKQHPNKQERLIVDVFADARKVEVSSAPPRPLTSKSSSTERGARGKDLREYDGDARFERQGDGAASGGGDNEWYTYAPDLSKPEQRKTVVLKGGRKFGPKNVLETWTGLVGTSEIRLRSYELGNVEPKGVYYTFEARVSDSEDWAGIMTLRLNERIPLPTEHLRVVNDQVTYFFLGWVYTVTTDAGKTWVVWDGENETSDSGIIENVSLGTDGVGRITYRVSHQGSPSVRRFSTRDFGRLWTAE